MQRRHDVAQLDRVLPIGSHKDAAAVRLAALRHVASSAAPLALVPVEDALGLDGQVNLPGTVDQHPNWRRRLPRRLGAALQEAMACMAEVRRKNSP
jgi:4-alpha-glucanotransferase